MARAMTPQEYCQDKAARSGSSFYYSFLFVSPERRRAITALYAFCREVDDVADECTDTGVARVKLEWWRLEVDRVFAGAPEHPVGKELARAVERHGLAKEHLQEVIDGMEMDLDQTHYPSFKNLSLYCHRVAGVVGIMAAEIFGYEDRGTLRYAHKLGMAFQLTNILRDVREDAMRGRVYLPENELARFGVRPEDLSGPKADNGLRALFSFQATRAREYYDQALALLPEADRYRQRSGLIMAAIYRTTLDEIENDGYRVLERRVVIPPLRKLWVAWKTALGESWHHHRRRGRETGKE